MENPQYAHYVFLTLTFHLAIPQTVVQDPEVHNTRGDLLGPLQPAKVLRIRACLRLTPGPGPPRGRECEVCVAFT